MIFKKYGLDDRRLPAPVALRRIRGRIHVIRRAVRSSPAGLVVVLPIANGSRELGI